MATNDAPQPPPPVGAAPKAAPISMGDLQRELSRPKLAPQPQAPEPPAPTKQTFKEDASNNVTLGDDKGNRVTGAPLPGFREAARKLQEKKIAEPEVKPEPVKPAKVEETKPEPKADAAKPKPEDDVPEEQRKVLPHDKPETARRIQHFLKETKRLAEERDALKKDLEAAKKAPATAANVEEVERLKAEQAKVTEELTRYRRLHAIDTDPEFKAKYKEPVVELEKTIEGTLKNYFKDDTLKVIKDEGGFAEFSRSNKTFVTTELDADGQPVKVTRTAQEIARGWLNGMNPVDKAALEASLGKQQLLKSEEKAAIQKALDESKTYFESQTAAQKAAAEEAAKKNAEMAAAHEAFIAKTETETDWLKDQEVPAEADEAVKKRITEANEFNKQLRAQLRKNPATVEEYNDMKLRSIQADHLRRTLGDREARIAELEEQLKRAQGANRTTPKAGSILRGGGKSETAPDPKADPTDLIGAMRKGIKKFQGGIDDE